MNDNQTGMSKYLSMMMMIESVGRGASRQGWFARERPDRSPLPLRHLYSDFTWGDYLNIRIRSDFLS